MRNGGHISRMAVLFLFITAINRFARGDRLENGINREITPEAPSLISSIRSAAYVSGEAFGVPDGNSYCSFSEALVI